MTRDSDLVFGQIALKKNFLDQDQIDDAVEHQQVELPVTDEMPIGEILVDKGYINREQLREILRDQRLEELAEHERPFGQLCVTNGFIPQSAVNDALGEQRGQMRADPATVMLLGEILVNNGLLTLQQVTAVLKAQGRLREHVGRARTTTRRLIRPQAAPGSAAPSPDRPIGQDSAGGAQKPGT